MRDYISALNSYYGLRDYGTATWEDGDAACDHVEKQKGNTRLGLAAAANATDGGNRNQANRRDNDNSFHGVQYRDTCGKCGARRIDQQIGLEDTPELFVARLVEVFREVRRILHPSGVLFLNLGDSFSSETIYSESLVLRDDLTDMEINDVAMAMFGMRFDGDSEARKGDVHALLPGESQSSKEDSRSSIRFKGVDGELLPTQGKAHSQDAGKTKAAQVGSNRKVGRDMRVLRGNSTGISNGGSYQQRRSGTSQELERQESGEFGTGTQVHSRPGVPTGQVSSSVLQLQLRDRVLGILSSHPFSDDEIPDQARFAFTRRVVARPKDALGIPWRVAFALQADGWILRQEIIWEKRAPMPESVTDRCTKAHEQVFLLAKSRDYFFDAEAIAEPVTGGTHGGAKQPSTLVGYGAATVQGGKLTSGLGMGWESSTRNRRSVWTLGPESYSGAHYAVMPTKLVEPCVLAGTSAKGACSKCGSPWERVVERETATPGQRPGYTLATGTRNDGDRAGHFVDAKSMTLGWQPTCTCFGHFEMVDAPRDFDEDGDETVASQIRPKRVVYVSDWPDTPVPVPAVVLDPFFGSGTVGAVALKHGRRFVGIDLDARNIELAERRIAQSQPLLLDMTP